MVTFSLTFGVELEFICVFPRLAFTNQHADLIPNDEENGEVTAGHAIMYHLLNANVPARGWSSIEEENHYDIYEDPYSRWLLQSDALHLSEEEMYEMPDDFQQESVEISSRVFRLGESSWSIELEKVLAVLHLMRQRYGCIFITNDTTGMHVHIGNDGGLRMPFALNKRVFQLMSAYEGLFDRLHSANRITAPDVQPSLNDDEPPTPRYAPLSFFHHSNSRGQHANPFDWLQQIENLPDPLHMGKYFDIRHGYRILSGHSAAVNFDNCCEDPDCHRHEENLKHTIEFRQHAGTLDIIAIHAYVSLLCSVVQFCHHATDVDFFHLLVAASDQNTSLQHFLNAISAHPDVLDHFDCSDKAILGVLPHPRFQTLPVTTEQDILTRLAAKNDIEQSKNLDRARVAAKIEDKYVTQYYGWDPTASNLPLTRDEVRALLEKCFEEVQKVGGGITMHQAVSDTRILAWMKLSAMYNELDSSLDPRLVIRRHLQGWL